MKEDKGENGRSPSRSALRTFWFVIVAVLIGIGIIALADGIESGSLFGNLAAVGAAIGAACAGWRTECSMPGAGGAVKIHHRRTASPACA